MAWAEYRSPHWQRRRFEILTRDHFACAHCDATDKELHVHHVHYVKGHKPWEYPDYDLITLCCDCHARIEAQINKARMLMAAMGPKYIEMWLDQGERLFVESDAARMGGADA